MLQGADCPVWCLDGHVVADASGDTTAAVPPVEMEMSPERRTWLLVYVVAMPGLAAWPRLVYKQAHDELT